MRTFLLALALLLSACGSNGIATSDADTASDDTAAAETPVAPVTVIGPLTWQTLTAPSVYTWTQAKAYCADLTLETFSDWRLPTKEELEGTIDTSGPDCPHIVAPLKATTGCDWYWTSTPFEGSASSAWLVYFYYGAGYVDDLSYKYRVRCVR